MFLEKLSVEDLRRMLDNSSEQCVLRVPKKDDFDKYMFESVVYNDFEELNVIGQDDPLEADQFIPQGIKRKRSKLKQDPLFQKSTF